MTKKSTPKNNDNSNYFKELLKNYIIMGVEISQNEKELTRLQNRRASISCGNEYSEEQREALRKVIDNVIENLVETQKRIFASRTEAEYIVSRLPSKLSTILRMRYFLGNSWNVIERELYDIDPTYTKSKILKAHNRAIALGEGIRQKCNSK